MANRRPIIEFFLYFTLCVSLISCEKNMIEADVAAIPEQAAEIVTVTSISSLTIFSNNSNTANAELGDVIHLTN